MCSLNEIFERRTKALVVESSKKQVLEDELTDKESNFVKKKKELETKDIARTLLQKTSDQSREAARTVLESTVTTALQHVFGPSFNATIETDISSGKPVADVYIVTTNSKGHVVKCKPEAACGGGIVDIVSIALRIAMIQLHHEPPVNGPIILDEPGKFVSADYSIKLAEFLKYVSSTFNKQIIFVTHNQDLKSVSDVCYVAEIKDGTTVVKQIDPRTGADLCTDVQTQNADQ